MNDDDEEDPKGKKTKKGVSRQFEVLKRRQSGDREDLKMWENTLFLKISKSFDSTC